MKNVYWLIIVFLFMSAFARGQGGAFKLQIDGTKNTVTFIKTKDAVPELDLDLDFGQNVPAKFKITVMSDNNGKVDSASITAATRNKIDKSTFSVRWAQSTSIARIKPVKAVTKIDLIFQLNGKKLNVIDHDIAGAQPDKASLTVFFSAAPSKTEPTTTTSNTTATTKSENPCEKVDPNTRYFIPPMEELIAQLSDETCTTCKNDYKVAYDLSSGEPKICYYERTKCTCTDSPGKKPQDNCGCASGQKYCYVPVEKRIRPRVGRTIGFHIFGYYPSFDSLSIDFSFESRNQELKDQFSAALSQSAPKTAEKPDSTKKQGEKAIPTGEKQGQLKRDSSFVKQIKDELEKYHDFLIKSSPGQEQVEQDVKTINTNLNSYCIHLATFSPAGLIEAIKIHLAKNKEDGPNTRLRILRMAQVAAAYYGYILNYSTMKVPVLQVPNEDMLKYTMGFFKGGKKLYTGNYSLLIRGGWKIDFSTGIVFNNLNDKEYVIKYDTMDLDKDGQDDDPSGQIDDKDKGKFNANVALMSHIYPRTGTRMNVGGTFGFVFQGGSMLKYIGGVSLMLGYEQRFVLSWGVIAGAVDRLDSSYNDAYDQPVARSRFSAISTAIPTVKKWEFGQFASLTYNFGGTTVGK